MSSLQQRIVAAWYRSYSWTLVLIPFSWLFLCIISLRCWYYSGKAHAYSRPVIVIGNIAVGGTGKTPLVIHLAKIFTQYGFKVGIVSRGYGAHHQAAVNFVTRGSDPTLVGDEPVMIATQTNCPVIIGKERSEAVEALIKHFPSIQLILSDDGLQHYKMFRDIEIAVIHGLNRFGNGFCLPAGPLREPLSRLNKVDYIVASHNALAGENLLQFKPKYFISLDGNENILPVNNPGFSTIHAIAGIGEPGTFFDSLEKMGLKVIKHVFPDHHLYKSEDLQFPDVLPIIMTEKDAVKCRSIAPINSWFLSIETILPKEFEQKLLNHVKGMLYGKEII